MKKKTKKNISKVFTIIGLIGLCYIVFVDHRPKEYIEITGSFEKFYTKVGRGRYGRRTDKINIKEHPKWFILTKNGSGYVGTEKYFKSKRPGLTVTLIVDTESLRDTIHSYRVYRISVNDSIIFNNVPEDAVINKTVDLRF
ncbi:MAG: hypothetical protein ACPGTP_02410 [Bacteroidia bacterium]